MTASDIPVDYGPIVLSIAGVVCLTVYLSVRVIWGGEPISREVTLAYIGAVTGIVGAAAWARRNGKKRRMRPGEN